jgi:hypothetical protein
MSAKDHPNHAPGVPMAFPPWLERLQIKYVNPVTGKIARYLPTFAVVNHRGRTSGKTYETVVNAYRTGSVLAILLAHGKTNWVKNVLAAGEADVHSAPSRCLRRGYRLTVRAWRLSCPSPSVK